MVNITNWDEFQRAAEELYQLSPNNCFKYKTDQLQDLNKFERLNRSLMAKMHNRVPAEPAAAGATTAQQPAEPAPAAPAQAPTSAPATSPAATPKPGGKKKNKRK
ncbi:hypothetical protein BGW42_005749 [Actinomortierella wolfii]|nr:hypothetical protein BGW42_005749 [Actinomortierella wolfii]